MISLVCVCFLDLSADCDATVLLPKFSFSYGFPADHVVRDSISPTVSLHTT